MPDKKPIITVDGHDYLRIPIKTHELTERDSLLETIKRYAGPELQPGDVVFISESAAAVTQGRLIPWRTVHPGFWAKFLANHVTKSSAGMGLGSPYTMEMAIRECGLFRILLAAVIGGITRIFGRRGDFYRIAGPQAALIDAAADMCDVGEPYPHPNFESIVLGPKDPTGFSRKLAEGLGVGVAIVDVNDIGGSWAVGVSAGVDGRVVEKALLDNPLGQNDEMTPFGILRLVSKENVVA
jgi:hypothetical protein